MVRPILNFLVSEWANFFFLVDNLAFPIDSMHRDYNQRWLSRFGKLSDEETSALAQYRNLKKSVWDRGGNKILTRFESAFYRFPESNPLQGGEFQKILTVDQLKELNQVFEVFRGRFQKMWREYGETLVRDLTLLEEEFSRARTAFRQIFFAVGKLYGVGAFAERIEIYLMMRPDPGFIGGRTVSREPKPKVMVEGGVFDPQDRDQTSHLWLLLLHELTHACFESDWFLEFLYAYLDKRPPLSQFLAAYPATKTPALATRRAVREALINSIEFGSFVREKLDRSYTKESGEREVVLREVRQKKSLAAAKSAEEKRSVLLQGGRAVYQYIAWKLEGVVRPYLERDRRLDEEFIDGVYKVLAEFPDNLIGDLRTEETKKGRL